MKSSIAATHDPFAAVAMAGVDAVMPMGEQARMAFIEIDVAGFERSALERARAILKASRPTMPSCSTDRGV